MRTMLWLLLGSVTAWTLHGADVIPGDAGRGAQIFETESCIQCHNVNGRGGRLAPDLGRRLDRNYTPAVLASLMWNHAPAMWTAMKERSVGQPRLTNEGAADLFAFFFSARYFEKPGDAGRGKQAFASKHCADCHGIATSTAANAPPVARWESLADPLALVRQMWNHSASMREAFGEKRIAWQQISSQELTDMLVYLQNLPQTRGLAAKFSFPESASGAAVFESKGCAKCHTGRLALENRLRNQTLTDIAAAMWNHAPRMQQPPPVLNQEEMRQVVGHVWARQFLQGAGNPERGKRVFSDKKCATCHNDAASGAPNLAQGKGNYSDVTMVSALWEHGPQMLAQMNARNLGWPRFNGSEMSDLIAYLNTLQ